MQRLRKFPLVVNGTLLNNSPSGPSANNSSIHFQSSVEANGNAVKGLLGRKKIVESSPASGNKSIINLHQSAYISNFVRQQQILNGNRHLSMSSVQYIDQFKRDYATKSQEKTTKAEEETTSEAPAEKKKGRQPRPKDTRAPEEVVLERTIPSQIDVANENPEIPRITIDELKQLIDTKPGEYVLVDLREREILGGEPMIKTAVSFPLPPIKKNEFEGEGIFKSAMSLNQTQFKTRYQFDKFSGDKLVIFYSNTGKRSDRIIDTAVDSGLKNVKSLLGGARLFNKYYNPEGVQQK